MLIHLFDNLFMSPHIGQLAQRSGGFTPIANLSHQYCRGSPQAVTGHCRRAWRFEEKEWSVPPSTVAWLPRTRFVDFQRPSHPFSIVQGFYGNYRLRTVWHAHKAEPPGTAGVSMCGNLDGVDLAIRLEHSLQILFRRLIGNVAYKDVHVDSSSMAGFSRAVSSLYLQLYEISDTGRSDGESEDILLGESPLF